jgi:hypothetical protein
MISLFFLKSEERILLNLSTTDYLFQLRLWIVVVPQTRHQTLVPSLLGITPVMSIMTPHLH